jgi:hypothetical protein
MSSRLAEVAVKVALTLVLALNSLIVGALALVAFKGLIWVVSHG